MGCGVATDGIARHQPGRLKGLDLEPLYQDCLLKSHERRETYDAIASELCDYGLEWAGSPVHALAYRCQAGDLNVYSMRYGDEVLIRPDLYKGFLLAHVSVRKGIEIESDGRVFNLPEGSVFFSAPKSQISLRWQEGCEQVIVRIPYAMLKIAERNDGLASGTRLPPHLNGLFSHQLSAVLAMARQPSDLQGFGLWQEAFQSSMAGFVGLALGLGGDKTSAPDPKLATTRDRRERLEEFIESRLDRPIQLQDLEQAAGLARSQLNQLTHETFGCAPMALVRQRRLAAVRRALEADPRQDITQLSLSYGFDHQGRFSQYYRAAFGEAPSETRARLRGLGARSGKNG